MTEYKHLNGDWKERHTPHTIETIAHYGGTYQEPTSARIQNWDHSFSETLFPTNSIFTLTMDGDKRMAAYFDQIEETFTYYFDDNVDYNDFSLALIPETPYIASTLAGAIGVGVVEEIKMWNEINQEYITYYADGTGTDFDILPDYGYLIKVGVDSQFDLVGYRPGHRSLVLQSDWNLIGWTSYETSISVATFKTLLDNPDAVLEMWKWVGSWELMDDTDLLNPGSAYWVKIDPALTTTLNYAEPELIHEGPPSP